MAEEIFSLLEDGLKVWFSVRCHDWLGIISKKWDKASSWVGIRLDRSEAVGFSRLYDTLKLGPGGIGVGRRPPPRMVGRMGYLRRFRGGQVRISKTLVAAGVRFQVHLGTPDYECSGNLKYFVFARSTR